MVNLQFFYGGLKSFDLPTLSSSNREQRQRQEQTDREDSSKKIMIMMLIVQLYLSKNAKHKKKHTENV